MLRRTALMLCPTAAVAGLIALAAVFAMAGRAGASELVAREYQIKAAFLYKAALFVEWPATAVPETPDVFVIGVLGSDPFGTFLDEIAATKKVGDKRIIVRRFETLEAYTPCHILFVAVSEHSRIAGVIERLRDTPVLLVADTKGFAQAGGALGLVIEDNKVRLEVNPAAAERAGLKISSKLLRLARLVKATKED
ncbi:MAG: YfiR family protein [Verrucomicrobia bacterium]|nr:YfiR family protein [Verrucomicrobiota bacterium]